MIGHKLSTDGDLVTHGEMWVQGKECIAQAVKTRLKLYLGEYFRDISDGVPWFEKIDGTAGILQKGYSGTEVENILRLRILETDGVLKILKFSTDWDLQTRKYSVSALIFTKYGETEVQYG